MKERAINILGIVLIILYMLAFVLVAGTIGNLAIKSVVGTEKELSCSMHPVPKEIRKECPK